MINPIHYTHIPDFFIGLIHFQGLDLMGNLWRSRRVTTSDAEFLVLQSHIPPGDFPRAVESFTPILQALELLVVTSQANLAALIAAGQAQKCRVGAMRIMAGRTFYVRPI